MKTLIILVISITESEKIQQIKEEIIKYLGIRMISDKAENLPVLSLNSELTTEDETKICNIIESLSKTGIVIVTDKIDNIGSNIIERI